MILRSFLGALQCAAPVQVDTRAAPSPSPSRVSTKDLPMSLEQQIDWYDMQVLDSYSHPPPETSTKSVKLRPILKESMTRTRT